MKSKLEQVQHNYKSNSYTLSTDDIEWLIRQVERNETVEESEWEAYANKMKASRDFWQDAFQRSQGIVLSDEVKIEKMERQFKKFKDIDLDYLISIEKSYRELINKHVELSSDKVYDGLMLFFQKQLLQIENDELYNLGKSDMIEETTEFIRELYNKEEY